jgi:hypothetical protein
MPSVERWDDRSEDILGLVSTYSYSGRRGTQQRLKRESPKRKNEAHVRCSQLQEGGLVSRGVWVIVQPVSRWLPSIWTL